MKHKEQRTSPHEVMTTTPTKSQHPMVYVDNRFNYLSHTPTWMVASTMLSSSGVPKSPILGSAVLTP